MVDSDRQSEATQSSNSDFYLAVLLASPVAKDPRWVMVPSSVGSMHLVDLDPIDAPVEPLFVPANDVEFVLLTRSNPTVGQVIRMNDVASIQNSNFNPSHPTRFTIHGWQDSAASPTNRRTAEEYLRHGDFNVSLELLIAFDKKLMIKQLKDDHR